jgi:hypothetical protein
VERLAAEAEKIAVSRGAALVLLLSSAVTGIMGMALLMLYNMSLASSRSSVLYPALYVGVLDFFVCALCFAGGVASLKRKVFPLTVASTFLLLASGIAALIALGWLYGLLFGAPQLVVSIAVLASLVALKARK